MLAYSGVDTTNPIAAESGQAAAAKATTITAPSVTGAAGDRLVGLFGIHGQHTIAPPASMTERTDIAQVTGSGQKVTSETADALLSTAGATGARVATADSSGYGIGQLIALKPIPGPPPDNQPPVIDSVSIDQSNPITATVLSATITSHDPDGTPVSYTYQWIKNGVDISGATGTTLDLSVAGNGDRGDAIQLRVVGSDGFLQSSPVTSSAVTVVNAPPAATVSLNSNSPDTNALLTATATVSDPDGDAVSLTYVWKVNGVVRQTTATTALTDAFDLSQPGNGDDGDTITVEVTPNDGSLDGSTKTATAHVGAPPPSILFRSASSAQNGVASSLVLPVPAGVVSGDVLLAVVDVGSTNSSTAPAGWTLVRSDATTTSGSVTAQYVYYHVAGGGEPSSYTWTFGGKTGVAGAMLAYSGVDTTNPIDAHSGQAGTTKSVSITAPSVTATVSGDMLVGLFGIHAQHTIAPAASMVERTDIAQVKGGGQKVTSETADALLSTAGATGARVATADSSGYGIGQLIALKPAP